jgi:hypothetical protein
MRSIVFIAAGRNRDLHFQGLTDVANVRECRIWPAMPKSVSRGPPMKRLATIRLLGLETSVSQWGVESESRDR